MEKRKFNKRLFPAIFVLVLILFGVTEPTHSEYNEITITPPNPTEADVITLHIGGGCMGCWEDYYYDFYPSGNDFGFFIYTYTFPPPPDTLCITLCFMWDITEEIGPLPAGDYNVQVSAFYESGWIDSDTVSFNVSPVAPLLLNDNNGDGLTNGIDILFLSQAYLGARGEMLPIIDLNGDGQVGGIDVLFSLQNYLGARPSFSPPASDPIELSFDPGTPTSANPYQIINLIVNVQSLVTPSAPALANFGNAAISVDGLPVNFVITSDPSGEAYLGGISGASAMGTLVTAGSVDPSQGQAMIQLTMGTSEIVVEASYNVVNPDGTILKTISAEIVITPSSL